MQELITNPNRPQARLRSAALLTTAGLTAAVLAGCTEAAPRTADTQVYTGDTSSLPQLHSDGEQRHQRDLTDRQRAKFDWMISKQLRALPTDELRVTYVVELACEGLDRTSVGFLSRQYSKYHEGALNLPDAYDMPVLYSNPEGGWKGAVDTVCPSTNVG